MIGVTLSTTPAGNAVEGYIDLATEAGAMGLDAVWIAQLFDVDALSVAALVGRAVPAVAVGTAAVPMHPRHPVIVASQALTAQAAGRGRFTLGIGLSNPGIPEALYGVPFHPPIRHLREYLATLRAIFTTGSADTQGETLTAVTPVPATVAGAPPVPILVGAVGPQAVRAAGELADGVLPLMVSPAALADSIVPTVTRAAAAAGRPAPRIVAVVPVAVVTSEVERVRAAARAAMAFYGDIPSWQGRLAAEGVANAADLGAIGDDEAVAALIRAYLDAGATDVSVAYTHVGGEDDRRRTWKLLGELNRSLTH